MKVTYNVHRAEWVKKEVIGTWPVLETYVVHLGEIKHLYETEYVRYSYETALVGKVLQTVDYSTTVLGAEDRELHYDIHEIGAVPNSIDYEVMEYQWREVTRWKDVWVPDEPKDPKGPGQQDPAPTPPRPPWQGSSPAGSGGHGGVTPDPFFASDPANVEAVGRVLEDLARDIERMFGQGGGSLDPWDRDWMLDIDPFDDGFYADPFNFPPYLPTPDQIPSMVVRMLEQLRGAQLIDPNETERQRVLRKAFEDAVQNSEPSIRYLRQMLSEEAGKTDRNHFTKAGRDLQSHNTRPGTLYPTDATKARQYNLDAQRYVDDILHDPNSKWERNRKGGIDVTAPDGRAIRYEADGSFYCFKEP